MDFKGVGSSAGSLGTASAAPATSIVPDDLSSHQQFNIFPAIFSRQLNFNACPQKSMMDDLRPNLVGVGNLLGVSGLLDDHHGHLMGANGDKAGGRKCNTSGSSAEDFTALYGALPHSHAHEHHPHTPAHTPPSLPRSIADHSGKCTPYSYLIKGGAWKSAIFNQH